MQHGNYSSFICKEDCSREYFINISCTLVSKINLPRLNEKYQMKTVKTFKELYKNPLKVCLVKTSGDTKSIIEYVCTN